MIKKAFQMTFTMRWNPGLDLVAVLISWLLVTGTLYTATIIVTPTVGSGLPYFFLYAILGATVLGIGIPLTWMVILRKRCLQDLGITTRYLGVSLLLQLVFAAFQYQGTLAQIDIPAIEKIVPLLALALAIGFFEAIFWRGWVLLRLEEAFGLLPAFLLGSLLYAAYHVGYGMGLQELVFLFFIGLLYAATFRLTKNIYLLWPVFQPMGQLVTLLKEGLDLPLISTLGFVEVLVGMLVLIWLAGHYIRKHPSKARLHDGARKTSGTVQPGGQCSAG